MAAVTICKDFGAPQKSLSLFPLFSHLFAMKWQSCFLGIPYPTALHPGALFPIKSLALLAHLSPQTIHFQVLDQSPVLGSVRGRPSRNKWPLWRDSSSLKLTS